MKKGVVAVIVIILTLWYFGRSKAAAAPVTTGAEVPTATIDDATDIEGAGIYVLKSAPLPVAAPIPSGTETPNINQSSLVFSRISDPTAAAVGMVQAGASPAAAVAMVQTVQVAQQRIATVTPPVSGGGQGGGGQGGGGQATPPPTTPPPTTPPPTTPPPIFNPYSIYGLVSGDPGIFAQPPLPVPVDTHIFVPPPAQGYPVDPHFLVNPPTYPRTPVNPVTLSFVPDPTLPTGFRIVPIIAPVTLQGTTA